MSMVNKKIIEITKSSHHEYPLSSPKIVKIFSELHQIKCIIHLTNSRNRPSRTLTGRRHKKIM